MRTIAHIVNPFRADETSDLKSAQPITFETMRIAKQFAEEYNRNLTVELHACTYPEDADMIPEDFTSTRHLEKSSQDVGEFSVKKKYPFFREIHHCLYENTEADYLIVTDVGLGFMPHFYLLIDKLIDLGMSQEPGWNIFAINKRTIPEEYVDKDEIPIMWAELGESHRGMECFVYPRSLWPRFDLGDMLVGVPWCEATFVINAVTYGNFHVFKKTHATFHTGDPRVWAGKDFQDYREYNCEEFCRILTLFFERYERLREEPVLCWFLQKLKIELRGYYPEVCQKLNDRSWTQLKKFASKYEFDSDELGYYGG